MDKVPLILNNVPTKLRWNNQNRVGEKCQNAISDLKNAHHFPRSRSFEVKFADKLTLTPSNFPTKFRGITKIDLEKSAFVSLHVYLLSFC